MAQRHGRGQPGGIIGLVRLDRESGGALDYDCMVQLGVRLADIPRTFGWDALPIMARHLTTESAVWRHLHPDEAPWTQPIRLAAIMADLFDAVRGFAHAYAQAHTKRKLKRPEPYPRPWAHDDTKRSYGADPIRVGDFDAWYYEGGDG